MQDQLIKLYQQYCRYSINDGVQKLDFSVDYSRLHKEISDFIIKNEFGFNSISLRLTKPSVDNKDYLNIIEDVRRTALTKRVFEFDKTTENTIASQDYVHWHPDLEGSYTQELVKQIEEYSGFSIGRVRLAWLFPQDGYSMHVDMEPMRFHIPLITNRHCYFIQNDQLYHMVAGQLYHILTASEHMADNFGKLPRLHLIYSTYYQNELEEKIKTIFTQETFNEIYYNHLDELDDKSLKTLARLAMNEPEGTFAYTIKGLLKILADRLKQR